MSSQVASIRSGLSFRQIIAFDVLRWNFRLGFAVTRRIEGIDIEQLRRRKRGRRYAVLSHLSLDLGLPPVEDVPSHHPAAWPLLR